MENSRQLHLPMGSVRPTAVSVAPTEPTGSPELASSAREECIAILAQLAKSVLRAERRREAGHE